MSTICSSSRIRSIRRSGSSRAEILSSRSCARINAKRSSRQPKIELDKIRDRVARGALEGAAAIGLKLGRVIDKYKVGKHLKLTITDSTVKYQILEPQVATEAALDGYVVRTGLPKKQMSAPDAVRSYKELALSSLRFVP